MCPMKPFQVRACALTAAPEHPPPNPAQGTCHHRGLPIPCGRWHRGPCQPKSSQENQGKEATSSSKTDAFSVSVVTPPGTAASHFFPTGEKAAAPTLQPTLHLLQHLGLTVRLGSTTGPLCFKSSNKVFSEVEQNSSSSPNSVLQDSITLTKTSPPLLHIKTTVPNLMPDLAPASPLSGMQ